MTRENYRVSTSDRERFERDGHILLRIAEPDMVDRYRPAIREECLRAAAEMPPIGERDTYGKAFLQSTNLWRRNETVKEFVFDAAFAQVAADLLGVEKVRLYHDQALFKEPGGGPTPWHQDQHYWPLDTRRTVTMWMPLHDIDDQMGCITFASGSHRDGLVADIGISNESDAELAQYVSDKGFAVSRAKKMSLGEATFHMGHAIHSAGGNSSQRMREVMTVIYFADGARTTEPLNEHQRADLDAWLDGIPAGKPAAGSLNPILN